MDFRVLGPLEAGDERAPLPLGGRKPRALLARLLLDANRTVSVERLVEDLWGHDPPDTAAKMVQIHVSQLRKVLPDGVLRTRPPGYVLELPDGAIDLQRFERLRSEGAAALAAGDAARAAERLREALALWRGSALAEFAEEPFAAPEQARLDELRLACLEDRVEADLALGRHGDLVGELEALVARHELRERLRRQLMLALHRSGREAEALAAYRAFRAALAEELGMEPSARMRELEQAILQQDPALQVAEPAAREPAPAAPVAPAAPAAPAAARPPVSGVAAVGREAELERLGGALAAALGGERRTVFVGGEPGIGKTTLVDAFLAGCPAELAVGLGQCIEHHGPGEPYMPVLDALARLAAGRFGPAVVDCLQRRAPTWLAQLPWLVEPDGHGALERRVRGATRDRMLREVVEALGTLAAERPVALVLEDLQWADPSTLEVLGALAARREPARLLVLATHRAPAGEREPLSRLINELCVRHLGERVSLGRLDAAAVAAYVAQRIPAAGPEAARRLHERTGGNPLFMRHLADHWLAGGDPEAGVPATLAAFVAHRLADLDPADVALLEAAAVAGREPHVAVVAAALEAPVEEVDGRARGLGLLEPQGDGFYAFLHDVYREVLYDGIEPERRAELHGRVGARLEEAVAGADLRESAAELAGHFVRAHAPGRAARFLKLAAEQALGRNAHEEGVAHLRAALDATAHGEPGAVRARAEVELHSMLGQALVALGGWSAPEAEEALVHARVLAEELPDNEPLVSVLLALATLYEVRGDIDRAHRTAEEYLALTPAGPPGRRMESHELLACNLFHQGAFTRALEHADLGVELFAAGGEDGAYSTFPATLGDNAAVSCLDWAGLALWFLGRPDQALERGLHAIRMANEPGRAYSLATAHAQLAVIHQCRGDAPAALEAAEATVASAEEHGYAYRAAAGRVLRGWALAALGDPEQGIEELLRGLQQSRAAGVHMDDPLHLGLLADAYRRGGELAAGLSAVEEGLAVGARERSVFYEPELHRLRGVLALAGAGATEDAEASLEQAVVAARRQGSRSLELRAALSLAAVWRERGQAAEARALVAAIHESFDEGLDTADLRAAAEFLSARPAPAAPRRP